MRPSSGMDAEERGMSSSRNNRRRKRNKRRFGLLFRLLAVVTVLIAVTFGATVFFKLEEVSVSGNQRYTAQQLVEASGLTVGDNLFQINKYNVASDILEKLPYVQSVSIRRVLPSGILLTVTESGAAGQIESEGSIWLVSVGGKLLEEAGDTDVVQISGLTLLSPRAGTSMAVSQKEQDRLQGLLGLLAALEERSMMGQVSAIELTPTRILLRYEGRYDVRLPISCDFVYKLRALEAAVDQQENYVTGTMDLTQNDYTVLFTPA